MSNFDLTKYLTENPLLKEELIPLKSLGTIFNPETRTFHPIGDGGEPIMDPQLAISVDEVDPYELWDDVGPEDQETLNAILASE